MFVVRHAETDDNFAKLCQGQGGSGLNARGRAQAAALGERLAKHRFDAIFCSDLQRATQTLDAVLQLQTQPPTPCCTPLLRERGFGLFEGQPIELYGALVRSLPAEERRTHRPAGGESWEDVAARCRAFLSCALSPQSTCVLVLTHGGCLRELMRAASVPLRGHVGNTAVFELEGRRTARSAHAFELVNSDAHDTGATSAYGSAATTITEGEVE